MLQPLCSLSLTSMKFDIWLNQALQVTLSSCPKLLSLSSWILCRHGLSRICTNKRKNTFQVDHRLPGLALISSFFIFFTAVLNHLIPNFTDVRRSRKLLTYSIFDRFVWSRVVPSFLVASGFVWAHVFLPSVSFSPQYL